MRQAALAVLITLATLMSGCTKIPEPYVPKEPAIAFTDDGQQGLLLKPSGGCIPFCPDDEDRHRTLRALDDGGGYHEVRFVIADEGGASGLPAESRRTAAALVALIYNIEHVRILDITSTQLAPADAAAVLRVVHDAGRHLEPSKQGFPPHDCSAGKYHLFHQGHHTTLNGCGHTAQGGWATLVEQLRILKEWA